MIYLVSFEPQENRKGNITKNSVNDYNQTVPDPTMNAIFVIGDYSSMVQKPDNPVLIAIKKNGRLLRPEQCEFAGRQLLGLQLATNNYHGGGELQIENRVLTLKGSVLGYGRYDRKVALALQRRLLAFFRAKELVLS